MPRKSKSTSNAKSRSAASEKDPQPTLTEEQASGNPGSPKDRDGGGKFAKGNAGGPGNPHARACAKMLEVFRNAISEEEMVDICRMLYLKAVGGDVSAAKIILSYKIGKPLPAPQPDSIDRDEWDHYQNDAVREDEMKLVLSSLPTHSGNDIARVSLPIMTAARMNDLAAQLLDGLPPRENAEKGENREEKGEKTNTTETPLANGKKRPEHAKKEDGREKKGARTKSTGMPLPNGKSKTASGGKKGRNLVKNQWMQPLVKRMKGKVAKEEAIA
jgi:hypothetical protein